MIIAALTAALVIALVAAVGNLGQANSNADRVRELRGEIREAEESLAREADRAEQAQSDLGSLRDSLSSLEADLETREADLEALEEGYADLARERDSLVAEVEELTEAMGNLPERERQVGIDEAEIQREQDRLAALEEEIRSREEAVGIAEDRIAANSFGSGTYEVGVDIEPGTYINESPGDSCYWERLRGTSGELADIIANDLPEGRAVVTVGAGEYFSSTRCGTWVLQGTSS